MAKPQIFSLATRMKAAEKSPEWVEKLATVTAYTMGATTCTVLFDAEDATEDPDPSILLKRNYLPNVGDRVIVRKVQGRKVIDSIVGVLPTTRVYRLGGLSPATGADTAIPWDTEHWDSAAMWSSGASTRIICPVAGIYEIYTVVEWAGNSTGVRELKVRKNSAGSAAGGTGLFSGAFPVPGATGGAVTQAKVESIMAANDYFEVFGRQTSGISLALQLGADRVYAEVSLKSG